MRALSTVRDHLLEHGPGPAAVLVDCLGEDNNYEHPLQEDMRQDEPPEIELYFDPFPNDEDSEREESTDDDEPEGGSEEDEPDDTDAFVASVQAMCHQLVESMAHKQITQQGVTVVLKILHGTVFKHCPPLLVMLVPADARLLLKAANLTPLQHHYRHFCPGPPQKNKSDKSELLKFQPDHYLFPLNPLEEMCPLCMAETRYIPRSRTATRPVLFYDLDGYLDRQYTSPELRALQQGWREDPRMVRTLGQYKWLMDGSIMAGGQSTLFRDMAEGEEVVVFAGCRDATVISHMSNTSLLPIVFDNLALPERVRKAPESKWIAALFPPGMKATRITQQPIAEMVARRMPGCLICSIRSSL